MYWHTRTHTRTHTHTHHLYARHLTALYELLLFLDVRQLVVNILQRAVIIVLLPIDVLVLHSCVRVYVRVYVRVRACVRACVSSCVCVCVRLCVRNQLVMALGHTREHKDEAHT